MLGFKSLPDSALALVRSALEGDGEFRERVAARAAGSDLDEGSKLFLQRPEGWREALSALEEDRERRSRLEELTRRDAEARSQLRDAHDRVGRLEDEARDRNRELERLRAELEESRLALDRLRSELAEQEARAGLAERERSEAVRQLKAAESLARRRLESQRELEHRLERLRDAAGRGEGGTEPSGGPTQEELQRAARTLSELTGRLEELPGLVRRLAADLGEVLPGGMPPDGVPGDVERSAGRARPLRSPRPGRGLTLDTPEGLGEMLTDRRTLLLVDGYNVSMQGWPQLSVAEQRESLLGGLGDLAKRFAAEVQVVFDGAEAGQRPAVATSLPVRVHFTPSGTEADDRLIEFAAAVAQQRPVIVASSDRRVREGVEARGGGAVSSGTLLRLLRGG